MNKNNWYITKEQIKWSRSLGKGRSEEINIPAGYILDVSFPRGQLIIRNRYNPEVTHKFRENNEVMNIDVKFKEKLNKWITKKKVSKYNG